jgi:hypothetical protein
LFRSPLQAEAPRNMYVLSVTFVTYHLLRSPLKAEAPRNMYVMSVTFATYHC